MHKHVVSSVLLLITVISNNGSCARQRALSAQAGGARARHVERVGPTSDSDQLPPTPSASVSAPSERATRPPARLSAAIAASTRHRLSRVLLERETLRMRVPVQ